LAWDQWSQYLAPWRVSCGTVMRRSFLSCMLNCRTWCLLCCWPGARIWPACMRAYLSA
jgi:hypothetical protein